MRSRLVDTDTDANADGDGDLRGRWAQELSFRPDNGDILIWPGWVEHTVPEQKACNNERVTLSFNISVKR